LAAFGVIADNALVSINAVTLRRARLVAGWVSCIYRLSGHALQTSSSNCRLPNSREKSPEFWLCSTFIR